MIKKSFLIGLLAMICFSVVAQNNDNPNVEMRKVPIQLAFINSISTNGKYTKTSINTVSINVLGGNSGGFDGFEMGSLYNIDQLGSGFQVAGLLNKVKYGRNLVQVAGLANYVTQGKQTYFQASGLFNKTMDVVGMQAAGLINISDDMRGLQTSGLCNFSKAVSGAQISGLVNIGTKIRGLQATGLVNISENIRGAQASGLVNVTSIVRGFSAAGLVNISKTSEGLSIAGLCNKTKKAHGLQIGLVNICDTTEGAMLGFINIAKKGRLSEFEVSFAEALNASVAYKLGTPKLYSIYQVGFNFFSDEMAHAIGFGFGTRIPLAKTFDMDIVGMYHTISYDKFWDANPDLMPQVKIAFSKEFFKHFKLSVAPTFNILIQSNQSALGSGETQFHDFAPYSMYDWTNSSQTHRVQLWLGGEIALRF